MADRNDRGETFGQYLIGLRDATGALGELVRAAKVDPKFPRKGNVDGVCVHLNAIQADGDMLIAVDDAETDWLS